MTVTGPSIERELAMVKVRGKGEHRVEALRLADAFRARVIDAGTESFVFEITGASEKIEQFITLMHPLGLVEVSRPGSSPSPAGRTGCDDGLWRLPGDLRLIKSALGAVRIGCFHSGPNTHCGR